MPLLPVLDLLHGQVVRGIAGRREDYRPLTPTADPEAVVLALRERFGFAEFYVADLDAITGRPPNLATYTQLQRHGFRLRLDAGVQVPEDAQSLREAGVARVVVGLETVAGPLALRQLREDLGDELIFSLDLKAGQPLGRTDLWPSADPWDIARHALALGVRRLLVLDLARVGVGEGAGTESLCARLRAAYPDLELTAGGGVRGPDDVRRLYDHGVDYVLVASALHDGRLTRDDVNRLDQRA